MDKDQMIAILLVAMAIVLTIQLAFILLKKKRKKEETEMFRKPSQPVETLADKAHNMIATTENISSTVAMQGVNTTEADTLLRQAKREQGMKNYAVAIEMAESAKLALLRAKRERDSRAQGRARPAEEASPDYGPPVGDYGAEEPKEERSLDSLPANYVQAKFMLATTRDLLEKKGITKGEAYDFYVSAAKSYEKKDYTKALSLAIKAERLLDSGTLTLIGEEKPAPETDEVMEVLACPECESEVSDADAFCRNCGQNLTVAKECPGCGTEYEPADKFCRKCGQKLR